MEKEYGRVQQRIALILRDILKFSNFKASFKYYHSLYTKSKLLKTFI